MNTRRKPEPAKQTEINLEASRRLNLVDGDELFESIELELETVEQSIDK